MSSLFCLAVLFAVPQATKTIKKVRTEKHLLYTNNDEHDLWEKMPYCSNQFSKKIIELAQMH